MSDPVGPTAPPPARPEHDTQACGKYWLDAWRAMSEKYVEQEAARDRLSEALRAMARRSVEWRMGYNFAVVQFDQAHRDLADARAALERVRDLENLRDGYVPNGAIIPLRLVVKRLADLWSGIGSVGVSPVMVRSLMEAARSAIEHSDGVIERARLRAVVEATGEAGPDAVETPTDARRWNKLYLAAMDQRDDARAERDRLRAALQELTEAERGVDATYVEGAQFSPDEMGARECRVMHARECAEALLARAAAVAARSAEPEEKS